VDCQMLIFVLHIDPNQPKKWRIEKLFSFHNLRLEHIFIVMLNHLIQNSVCSCISLNNYLPLNISPSRSTAYLSQHREASFKSTKVGVIDQAIGIHNTDQTYFSKIQTLGNHLGTDKNIESVFIEII